MLQKLNIIKNHSLKISDEIITFRKEHKNFNLSSFKSPSKKENHKKN